MPDQEATSDPSRGGETIAELIDARHISRLQILVITLVTAVMVFDGLSLQILGYATPAILADWQVTKLQLSPAVAVTAFGMLAGTFFGGRFGDRWGRKPVLVGAILVFGVADIGCAAAGDVQTLTAMRLISGLAFGACFPNAAALVAEWTPRRAISQAVGIMTVGIPVGGIIGALITIFMLERWGWQGSFIAGGLLSIALGVIVAWLMPESPGWMSRRGPSAKLDTLLARAWQDEAITWKPPAPVGSLTPSLTTPSLFERKNTRTNVAVWLGFFTNTFVATALLAWGTTALTGMGVALQTAIGFSVPYNLASIAFVVGASVAGARYGTRVVLTVLAAATCLALTFSAVLGLSGTPSIGGIGTLYVAAGGFIGGIQAMLFVLAANSYPLAYRSTGVGTSSAVGRVGGIASSFGGGAILSVAPPAAFFAVLSGAILMIVVCAILADRHVAARPSGDPAS